MNDGQKTLIRLMRMAVGCDDVEPMTLTEREWTEVYKEARCQSLTGVIYGVVNRMGRGVDIPRDLMLGWTCRSRVWLALLSYDAIYMFVISMLNHVIVHYICNGIHTSHILKSEILIIKYIPLIAFLYRHGRYILEHRNWHYDFTAICKIDRHLSTFLSEIQSFDSDIDIWHLAHCL